MEIELLYVADCPNYTVARDRLTRALARAGRAAVVRERQVHSPAEATQLGMRGSPTILINGQDPLAVGDEPPALSCRTYPGGVASYAAPTVDELVELLAR